MQIATGTIIDHFRVERLIGHGGMGEVYAARDIKLDRKVALKLVRPEALGTPEAVERFLHEARTTARFSHPNIVQVHFVGEHEGRPYVALEYLEGATLRDRMKERGPPLEETLRIGLAIAEALEEAHAHGVLHRDLKPENVILSADDRVRLVDFGLAKNLGGTVSPQRVAAESAHALGEAHTEDLGFHTEGMALMGTPAYMAPEQWSGGDVTPAVDVWALGLVLVELLTGKHPYASPGKPTSPYALAARICGPDPVPLPEKTAKPAPGLTSVIRACLVKAPSARPTSAEAAKRLRAVKRKELTPPDTDATFRSAEASPLELSDTVSMSDGTPDPPATTDDGIESTRVPASRTTAAKRLRWRLGVVMLGIIAALGIAGATWMLRRDRQKPPSPAVRAQPKKDAGVVDHWTAVWQPLPKSKSPAALAAFERARAAYRAGRIDESKALYEKALEADPGLAAAHLRLASDLKHLREARRLRNELSRCDRLLLAAEETLFLGEQSLESKKTDPFDQVTRRCAHRPEVLLRAIMASHVLVGQVSLAQGVLGIERVLALDPGFSWAWSIKGHWEGYLGRFQDALRSFRSGLRADSGAAHILTHRMMIHAHFGNCSQMEADARRLIRLAPSSIYGYRYLAVALAAQDRSHQAVKAALSQAARRSHFSIDRPGSWQQYADNASLHDVRLRALNGDLGGALAALSKWYSSRKDATSRSVHSARARLRLSLLQELGRRKEALQLATNYLKRRDAWQSELKVDDWAVFNDARPRLWGALHEAGRLSTGTLVARLESWADSWKNQSKRIRKHERGYLWLYGLARATHDVATARAALDSLPKLGPIPPFRPLTLAEADVGRTYYLAGKSDEAIHWLEAATHTCRALMFPIQHTRAHYWLGRALQDKGRRADACRAYATVLSRWGHAKPHSVTAAEARARSRALGCTKHR